MEKGKIPTREAKKAYMWTQLKTGSCPPKPLPFFWRLQAVSKVGGEEDTIRKTGSKNNMLSKSFLFSFLDCFSSTKLDCKLS